jgi:hypothetical protein
LARAVEGVELEQIQARGANPFYIRGGRVTKLVAYWDRERAFADLSLASQAGSPAS